MFSKFPFSNTARDQATPSTSYYDLSYMLSSSIASTSNDKHAREPIVKRYGNEGKTRKKIKHMHAAKERKDANFGIYQLRRVPTESIDYYT